MMTYTICDVVYYSDIILQYPNQESIESILLWSFSIFLSNIFTDIRSIFSYFFTDIKSIFSYFFMFFFKQSKDDENKSEDDENKSEDDENTKTIIQDLQQIAQLVALNNDTNKGLTSHSESDQRNKELIALARYETYLKLNIDTLIVIIFSSTNVAECIPLSRDYACFSVTALISKLEKLKDMSVEYEIESKSALVVKYQEQIESQKEYMRDQKAPYPIETLDNHFGGNRSKLITRFAELRKNQVTFLKQHEQMLVDNDYFADCMEKVPPKKLQKFYDSIMPQIQNLANLPHDVERLNNNMGQLRKTLQENLRELDRHVEDVLTLERAMIKCRYSIRKYNSFLQLDNSPINKSSVQTKLNDKNNKLSTCNKHVDNSKQKMIQIQSNLSSLFTAEENLLKQCYDMCTRGKTDIADSMLRLTKEFGITSTTNKGTKDESRTILKDKGPLTPKVDVKKLIINKKQSGLINVSEGIQNTGESSDSIHMAKMITDETPNG
jgi:hypothetical protein